MRLAPKILLLIAICTFVTMSITSVYVITSERKSMLNRAYSEAKDINAGMINSIVSVMTLGIEDPDLIHNYVESLRIEKENVLQVRLVHPPDIASILIDKDIAKRYRPRAEEHPRLEIEKRALAGEMIQQEVLFTRKGQGLRAVQNITPISTTRKCLLCHSVEEGATLAALSTTVSLEPAFQAMRSRTKVLAAIMAVGFLGTLILLYYALQALVVRPVSTISQMAQTIAKNRDLTDRIERRSRDEIGDLAASFNKMAEDLQKTTVSRDYMDNIVTSMINSLIVVTPEAVIQTVNQATCDLLGYEAEDLTGEPVKKIISEKGLPAKGSWVDQVIKKDSIRNIEKTYHSRDGTEIPVLFSASVMRDAEGEIRGVVCAAQSIAELKRAEEALRRIYQLQTVQYQIAEAASAAENLDTLFRSIHHHLATVIDTTNFYIAFYDAEKELLSFPYFVDEVDPPPEPKRTGKGLTEYVLRLGESLFATKKEMYDLAERGEIELIGTPSELWLGVPLRVESEVVGVVAVQSYTNPSLYMEEHLGVLEFVSGEIADAIVHKRAEEALRESEERYRSTVESMKDLIFFIDRGGYFRDYYRPAGGKLFASSDLFLGKRFDKILPQHVAHPLSKAIKTVSNGEQSQEFEYPLDVDGEACWYHATITGRYDAREKLMGVTVVVRDITERKKAEELLRRSEQKYRRLSERLMEANSMKELLLDVITHDLKNPAGVISGMSDIMVEETPEDETSQIIRDCSHSLLKVIENATLLAKVTMGEEIDKQEMDLAQVIRDVANEFSPFLKDSGMSLECQLDEPLPVRANPIISEVLKNYISNAIRYASDGEKIVIEATRDEDLITVAVKDLGRTIPEKDQERIFVRKTQLAKEDKIGRGLGLAIVKRIAEAHDADVWVEPNEPTGNIFYLRMPGRS